MNTWNFSIKLIKKIRMKPINISESKNCWFWFFQKLENFSFKIIK
jgi:hypothetical protein